MLLLKCAKLSVKHFRRLQKLLFRTKLHVGDAVSVESNSDIWFYLDCYEQKGISAQVQEPHKQFVQAKQDQEFSSGPF